MALDLPPTEGTTQGGNNLVSSGTDRGGSAVHGWEGGCEEKELGLELSRKGLQDGFKQGI